jgi:DNA-binding XRE family transcriptional regulator
VLLLEHQRRPKPDMSFGKRMAQVRKEKNMSQDALAKALEATSTTIGRYERDEVKPSIDVAAKIAATLEVSVDFLVGNSDNFIKDKALLKRINEILKLSDKDREHVFALLDAFLRDAKAKKVYSH